MWVVRAVQYDDLDRLLELVRSATQGLTTLQLDRDRLLDRVEQSVFAFSRRGRSASGEPFVLVLTDTDTGAIAGTSTVYAKTGGYQPFYTYELVTSEHHSEMLGLQQRRTRLELRRIYDGPTEIGSLFLKGRYRGEGRGRWLSLARFAVIASRPSRFAERVIAEMRGRTETDGTVPFWAAVAGRFIPTDFATADSMSTVSKQFIEEMMPDEPVYLALLPEHVCDWLGQVHEETLPAVRLLEAEGFCRTNQVDIFDGGPVLSCETPRIDAVGRSVHTQVASITDAGGEPQPPVILASDKGGFTSVLTDVHFDEAGVTIARAQAEQLDLEPGAPCLVLPLRRPAD